MKNSLKVERAKKDMTQAELAKLVNVSRQTINAIESGDYNLSTILALKISKVFQVNVKDIFLLEAKDL
jgi:putative transcriptional regulator